MPALLFHMAYTINNFIHWFFSGICHQIPERTFKYGIWYYPVCGRDTGTYLGIAFNIIVLFFVYRFRKENPLEFPKKRTNIILLLLCLPFVIDSIGSFFGIWDVGNDLRFLSGLLFGSSISIYLLTAVFNLFTINQYRINIAIFDDLKTLMYFIIGIIVICIIFLVKNVFFLFVSALSILFVIWLFNYLIITILLTKKVKIKFLMVISAVLLAFIELISAAYIKNLLMFRAHL